MRIWAIASVALCISFGSSHQTTAPWSVELEWGDSIPAGTVYTVKIDGTGALRAERKGLPFTSGGLTVRQHHTTLRREDAATIRASAERLIRDLDLHKNQGRMAGDGGFLKVQVCQGSTSFSAALFRLLRWEEAGEDWLTLLGNVRRVLPDKFVE